MEVKGEGLKESTLLVSSLRGVSLLLRVILESFCWSESMCSSKVNIMQSNGRIPFMEANTLQKNPDTIGQFLSRLPEMAPQQPRLEHNFQPHLQNSEHLGNPSYCSGYPH